MYYYILSIYLSIYLFIYLPIYLSIYLILYLGFREFEALNSGALVSTQAPPPPKRPQAFDFSPSPEKSLEPLHDVT